MIKPKSVMSSLPKATPSYQITATLLNSWQRIFDVPKFVRESEDDEIAYEDKVADAMEAAKAEFMSYLSGIEVPDTEAMRKGREYEADVYAGKDPEFSPIVDGGEFQAEFSRRIEVNGMKIVLYGFLDCLKAGRIYDIKRVGRYSYPKYKTSHQHAMYFALVPNAIDFTYLVMDDSGKHHYERYEPCNCEDVTDVVARFLSWLEGNGAMDTFKANWDWSVRSRKRRLRAK